jgi:hypothetical protein
VAGFLSTKEKQLWRKEECVERRSLIAVLGVAMLVGLLAMGLEGNRAIETLVATAPARVVAYLDTVGIAPQGPVICRPEHGVFLLVGIECEAMVDSVRTRFACNADTCWPR